MAEWLRPYHDPWVSVDDDAATEQLLMTTDPHKAGVVVFLTCPLRQCIACCHALHAKADLLLPVSCSCGICSLLLVQLLLQLHHFPLSFL